MASRSHGRQLAVQVLYQEYFAGYEPDRVFELFWSRNKADETTRAFCDELAEGVLDHRPQLDLEIGAYLQNWSLERIAVLDRIILEIAFYELMHQEHVPWKVVVDEAVRLAKLFSSEKSATFINGVLHAWSTRNRPDFNGEPRNSGSGEDEDRVADRQGGGPAGPLPLPKKR